MTNMSMVTIIDYNDRIYIINLNPLDPDCRIAVSAVYRALGTLNIAIIAPLRHHQPHHHQQRANKKIIKRAGTRDDAEADIVQHTQCSRQEGRRQVPNLQIWPRSSPSNRVHRLSPSTFNRLHIASYPPPSLTHCTPIRTISTWALQIMTSVQIREDDGTVTIVGMGRKNKGDISQGMARTKYANKGDRSVVKVW